MTEKKAEPPKKLKITLKSPHTHAGKLHKVGETITVREDQAERLIKAKIATGA